MKLEVVVIPVLDVGRSAEFYERLAWRKDADLGEGDMRSKSSSGTALMRSEVFHDAGGDHNRFDPSVRSSGPDPARRTGASFVTSGDPDAERLAAAGDHHVVPRSHRLGPDGFRVHMGFRAWRSGVWGPRRAREAHRRVGQGRARLYAAYMAAEQAGTELPS